jgi:hypothetical protein
VADFLDNMSDKPSRAGIKGKPETEEEVKWRILTAEYNCSSCLYFRGDRNKMPCDFYYDIEEDGLEDSEGCSRYRDTV